MSPNMRNVVIARVGLALSIVLLTAACGNLLELSAKPVPATQAAAQNYDKAVLAAATALFTNAKLPETSSPKQKYPVVIDPLIDGMTGQQSVATRSMGIRLAGLVREHYPQYEVQAFSPANIAKSPLVLIGTFTGVNEQRQTSGQRAAYRICFALADLRTGKLVSKGLAFALPDGVDISPLAFFRDAPAWTEDPATEGYIRTCQGTKAGDPINPLYLDRILVAARIAEAVEAYDAGRYKDALELYTVALGMPGGDQFRVHNGIYLANWRLGRQAQAETAFARIVDFGLEHKRLAVKFLFSPGSSAFVPDQKLSGPYQLWLRVIADRAAETSRCLELTGHTSPTGPEPLNERLSQLRAEYVRSQLEKEEPALGKKMIAHGVGSQQTLVGNGHDDNSDALDRRVEFRVIGC